MFMNTGTYSQVRRDVVRPVARRGEDWRGLRASLRRRIDATAPRRAARTTLRTSNIYVPPYGPPALIKHLHIFITY